LTLRPATASAERSLHLYKTVGKRIVCGYERQELAELIVKISEYVERREHQGAVSLSLSLSLSLSPAFT